MESFVGSWKLETSENFDELMQRLGVNFVTRKAGNATKPTVTFAKVDDSTWSMKTSSTFKNSEIAFKLGEEFDEKTLDGRHVKSMVTVENGAMHHVNTGDKVTNITRTIEGNNMVVVSKVEEIVSKRVYTKV